MKTSEALLSEAENLIHGGDWYESAEIGEMTRLLSGVKTFVDVGSSIGPYSAAAAQCLENSRIVALEAHPQTYEVLCKKMAEIAALCQSRGNVIQPLHAAASNEEGTIDFYLSNSDVLTSTLAPTEQLSKGGLTKVSVRAVTLDQLFADDVPDFVKVDVEGVEWRVLAGSKSIHGKGKTRFLVEIHPWGDPELGKKPSDVLSLMSGLGYGLRRIHRHWLFEPGCAGLGNRLKSRLYGFILDRVALRKIARSLVEFARPGKSASAGRDS
jgi:FkbM family methyltransferase